jgi:tryptophan synthase alpha chain
MPGAKNLNELSVSRPLATQSPIAAAFESIPENQIGLIPFVPAGYPDLQTTAAVLQAMDASGAAVIELGFPFSDPIADGPIIQQAFTAALARNLKIPQIFQTIKGVKLRAPVVAMVSYSIVFRYGSERFFAEAKSSGFSGMIIPDLPPPEAQKVCGQIRAAGLDTILFIAPTTTEARRKEIVPLCTGFVYYLSVSGITGFRAALPPDIGPNVAEIRKLTQCPVCVGFGISKPEHVNQLRGIANGAIIGTAIVKQMMERSTEGADRIAEAVGAFCMELQGKKC